jgi:MerR family transcriptional regulator, light-induced transcriptional regulator
MKDQPSDELADARHPIAVVAERTGLSQDVLRVWERRYGAVHPARGPGGQRLYRDSDVERLRLLTAATRAGRSISQVAGLSLDEIATLVDEDAAARRETRVAAESPDPGQQVEVALALTRALDATQLDATLRRAAAVMGISVFLESVVVPLLRRVGTEWHAGRLTPAQEHLASSIVYDIITETMRSLTQKSGGAPLLVATLSGERHSIGAALVGVAAAVENWKVIYLGADLPPEEIAAAAATAGVRVVAISVVYVDDSARVLADVRSLRTRLPASVTLIAGGAGAGALSAELAAIGVRVGTSLDELKAELRRR